MKHDLLTIVGRFKDKKIVVIGDLMIDEYIKGEANRLSPEAPIPVLKLNSKERVLGGAANVANNVASLGGEAYVCGVIGKDENGKIMIDFLKKNNVNIEGIVVDKKRPTILKTRFMAQHMHHFYQQILRVDSEDARNISVDIEKQLINHLMEIIPRMDMVIVSDYNKGVFTKDVIRVTKKLSEKYRKETIVDSKPNKILFFRGYSYITPNRGEVEQILGIRGITTKNSKMLGYIGKKLFEKLNPKKSIIMTCGGEGMVLYSNRHKFIHIPPTKTRDIYDVSGAGDTVVAALSLALSSKASLAESAKIANYAAGVVVGKVGTATVSDEELKGIIEKK
jgi:D-beta-D-heptose 7-phosphate kinase/D-beta-D-heptose 1-phosphate adenosyltransferase